MWTLYRCIIYKTATRDFVGVFCKRTVYGQVYVSIYVETNNPQIHALCHARSVYKDKEKKNLHDIEYKLIFQTLGYQGLHLFAGIG